MAINNETKAKRVAEALRGIDSSVVIRINRRNALATIYIKTKHRDAHYWTPGDRYEYVKSFDIDPKNIVMIQLEAKRFARIHYYKYDGIENDPGLVDATPFDLKELDPQWTEQNGLTSRK